MQSSPSEMSEKGGRRRGGGVGGGWLPVPVSSHGCNTTYGWLVNNIAFCCSSMFKIMYASTH